MRIRCLHGYFKIDEMDQGQISNFMSRFGFSIVPKDDFFTFSAIQDAPDYTIKGQTILGVTAIKTFEGTPQDVFRQNTIVYDFNDGTVKLLSTVTQQIEIVKAGGMYLSNGLILPGSLTKDGLRVTDYTCYTNKSSSRWHYTEVKFV